MICPKCGHEMSMGTPHSETFACQYECPRCGEVVGIENDKFCRRCWSNPCLCPDSAETVGSR